MHNCWPYIALVYSPFFCKGNHFSYSNSQLSLTQTHTHLVLAVTAGSHRQYSLATACKTISKLWHFPLLYSTTSHDPLATFCTKAEFGFALKQQTQHGQLSFIAMPSFVVQPLTITLILPVVILMPLLSRASLISLDFFVSHSAASR